MPTKLEMERGPKKWRRRTPIPFAKALLGLCRSISGEIKVAVLWTERKSNWYQIWPEVEIWGIGRDANKYAGPYPIIAHPPCGPWGQMRPLSKESKEYGIKAIELVHAWGGIIEHPESSTLFEEHGRPGAVVIHLNQRDYGHPWSKPTKLYIVPRFH